MAKLVGDWKIETSENFDEYMKKLGVNFALRKMANLAKPTTHILLEGDTYILQTKSTVKNTEIKFKLGEEFDEKTADGRTVKTTCSLEEDNKLIQSQKGDVDSVLTRVVDDDTLTLTCEADGVVCTRVYKRIQ